MSDMKLTRLAGTCQEDDCPTVFLSDRGTLVLQGDAVTMAAGLKLGAGEQAVELPVALIREALSALGQ